jgi:hypothetical protein
MNSKIENQIIDFAQDGLDLHFDPKTPHFSEQDYHIEVNGLIESCQFNFDQLVIKFTAHFKTGTYYRGSEEIEHDGKEMVGITSLKIYADNKEIRSAGVRDVVINTVTTLIENRL